MTITFPPIADTPIGIISRRWVRTFQGRWGLRFANRRDVPDIAVVFPTGGDVTEYTAGGQTWRAHVFDYTGAPDALVVTQTIRVKRRGNAGGGAGGAGHNNGILAFPGGPGGAGADLEDELILEPGTYPLYVGKGGEATLDYPGDAQDGEATLWNGTPDSITSDTLILDGGGGGGRGNNGRPGGSGGGGAGIYSSTTNGGAATYGSFDGGVTTDDGTRIKGSPGTGGTADAGRGGGPNSRAGSVSSITGESVAYSVGGPRHGEGTTAPGPGSGGKGAAAGNGSLGDDGVNGRLTIAYRAA